MVTKSSITLKPGDDIEWAGALTRAGVSDHTGHALKAQFRSRNQVSGQMGVLLADAMITWLDEVAGLFHLSVARALTATWPAGIDVLLDVSVLDPDGKRIRTETVTFKTEPGVTETI